MPILKEGAGLDFVLSGGELTIVVNPTEVGNIMLEGEDADLLGSGVATDGQVLTADGAGGAAWEDPSTGLVSVDSDDVGNVSTVSGATVSDALESLDSAKLEAGDDADLLGSGVATDGYVLTADGAGGAAWEVAAGGSGAVDSVFSRTGVVVAQAGDYDTDQIDNASTVAGATLSAALEGLDTDKLEAGDDAAVLGSGASVDGQVLTSDGLGGAAWESSAISESATLDVSSSRDLSDSDHNNVLLAVGPITLTLPSNLSDDRIIMVIATSGVVNIEAGAGSTLADGNFELDATNGIAVATVIHETGGQWYAIYGEAAAPKAVVVASGASLTLDATHDGAIIEVADSATVTTGGSLPSGWSCTLVRVGATAATIARGTGHTLYGPGGDASSFTIDNQWEAAALYSRGSDAFVLIGPVS